MHIESYYNQNKPVISFELFPPRSEKALQTTKQNIEKLIQLQPDFISVTCHNHANLPKYTQIMCEEVQKYNIPAIAHLTAYGQTKETLQAEIDKLAAAGIHNVLALRGDILDTNEQLAFTSSVDLIENIREMNPTIQCSGTCYPIAHPESRGENADFTFLKQKQDAGAKFLISQLFFDNDMYFDFVEKARAHGTTIPISAGIMPVTNRRQVERICALSGVEIPPKYQRILDRFGDNDAQLFEAGIAYATEQIIDLVTRGVDGIHLYTLNNIDISTRLTNNIYTLLNR